MSFKRMIGLSVILIGIVLLFISNTINQRLDAGKEEIAKAKKQISQGEKLFSLNPVTKELGHELTGAADKKIKSGEQTIEHYAAVAKWCQYGGIGLIALGTVVVIFGGKKRKK